MRKDPVDGESLAGGPLRRNWPDSFRVELFWVQTLFRRCAGTAVSYVEFPTSNSTKGGATLVT
jgi:hypothetical protein